MITDQEDDADVPPGSTPADGSGHRSAGEQSCPVGATGALFSIILGMLLTYAVIALFRGQTPTVAVGTPIVLGGVAVGLAQRVGRSAGLVCRYGRSAHPDLRGTLLRLLRLLVVPGPDLDDDGFPGTVRRGGIGTGIDADTRFDSVTRFDSATRSSSAARSGADGHSDVEGQPWSDRDEGYGQGAAGRSGPDELRD